MKENFEFRTPQTIFGNGEIKKLEEKVQELGAYRVLILTDPGVKKVGLIEKPKEILEKAGIKVDVYDQVEPEPSIEMVDKCFDFVVEKNYDVFIGIGGGSSIDVAKIVAMLAKNEGEVEDYFGINLVARKGKHMIAIPTTSGTGAEVTPNAIVTDTKAELKKGIVSPYLIPDIALIDPELTLKLPSSITASTGVDALTHSIESYISKNASPLSDMYALESISLISKSIRTAVNNGSDKDARRDMAQGSWYGGVALTHAGTGAVHALAYPLGGKFKVPHGTANAMMLKHVMEFNYVASLDKFRYIAEAMEEDLYKGTGTEGLTREEAARKALTAIEKLVDDVGIPKSLKDVGVSKSDVNELAVAASQVTRLLNNNPRKATVEDIKNIYLKAL